LLQARFHTVLAAAAVGLLLRLLPLVLLLVHWAVALQQDSLQHQKPQHNCARLQQQPQPLHLHRRCSCRLAPPAPSLSTMYQHWGITCGRLC
jgi:hypothetical protein